MKTQRHHEYITYQGQTLTPTEWARKLGLAPSTILYRISRDLPTEIILSPKRIPKEYRQPTGVDTLVTYKGETRSLADWAKVCGVPLTRVMHRFRQGYTAEDMFSPKLFRTGPNILKLRH